MKNDVYITGTGCLSPCGLSAKALLASLSRSALFAGDAVLGKGQHHVAYGQCLDFSEQLAEFVAPLKRRKMSRLSRMAVTVAGLALSEAGLLNGCTKGGVILGTGFGSTSQSELFYQDMLGHAFIKANPGLFPETVPNSPAGQISITYGLHGPNTTLCQQSLSSELALMTACDLVRDGKLDQVVVVGLEEMSSGLLSGLWGCGVLQKKPQALDALSLQRQMIVGEGAFGLVLESRKAVEKRGVQPLAALGAVQSSGAARWPAAYVDIEESVAAVAGSFDLSSVDCLISSASFIKEVDALHRQSLAAIFPHDLPILMPEYHTGSLFGAGLIKHILAVALLQQDDFVASRLGEDVAIHFDMLYPHLYKDLNTIYTSALTAGGGCAGTIISRVN